MVTKLNSWGHSVGVRLSRYVIERSGMLVGDSVHVVINDAGDILIRPVKPRGVHPGYAQAGSKRTAKTVVPTVEEKW